MTMRSFRAKPVGWRGESYRHALAARGYAAKKYDAEKNRFELFEKVKGEEMNLADAFSLYAKKDSDFVRVGGETFFKGEDGLLVNTKNANDIRSYDANLDNEVEVLGSIGLFPWESMGAVRGAASQPIGLYAKKGRVGVLERVHGIPIKAEKVEKGRIFPITAAEVKKIVERMPAEDVKGIKGFEFVNPKGEQKVAWAQFVRSTKIVKIFSQPYDGTRIDGEDPKMLRRHLKMYVLPHEIGHHKALRTGFTDKKLNMAEARADANVVGLDPYDRDVKVLVRPGGM